MCLMSESCVYQNRRRKGVLFSEFVYDCRKDFEFRYKDPTGIGMNFTDEVFRVPTVFLNNKQGRLWTSIPGPVVKNLENDFSRIFTFRKETHNSTYTYRMLSHNRKRSRTFGKVILH